MVMENFMYRMLSKVLHAIAYIGKEEFFGCAGSFGIYNTIGASY